MIEFEFDEAKSRLNLGKHGIDLREAQALWKDPDLLEIQANFQDEPRFLVIGLIGVEALVGTHYLSEKRNTPHFCKAFSGKGG